MTSPPPPAPPTVTTLCPASGSVAGGTQVTIQGTGFLTGAAVRFGGVLATSVEVSSSTSIIATTPAHAVGSVDVQVTNADGESGTLANGYTYISLPPNVVIQDDFNDNCLDSGKWTPNGLFSEFIDLSMPISEISHQLEIGALLQNTDGSHYRGIRTIDAYDFTGAYSYVELVQPASTSTQADAMFTVGYSVDNLYRIYVSQGNLIGLKKIGGVKTTFFTLPYDANNHRFLRIRHDAATNSVVIETAPTTGTGPGTWTKRYAETWSSSVPLSAIQFELKGGTWQAETNAPGKVIFDSFLFSR
ncbi:MAG: IPT/TIG domain-containing protein [Pyrinomonadaceae bacterium]